ncbi:MAG: DUF4097 domain-containing protein [Armatimonadota bacterium]|nr:DUF4097 domain-containing protein [Armatimonadota bacterium]
MRWRVFGAVVFAFACSYAILWSFGYARARLGEAIEEIAEQIEVGCQPRFEVKRATLTLPAGEEKPLRIENLAGRVEVMPGGPDTVAEYVIHARGENEADARRRAEPVEVHSAREAGWGDKIWVALKKGKRWPPHVSVELVVKTPPERVLSIRVISADINVAGIHGGIKAEATSGDVRITGSGSGRVVASSTSGDLHVEDADGPVEACATGGSISLAGLRGPATAATVTSGDLWLSRVQSKEVSLNSSSGDISIGVTRPFSERLESHSVSGSVGLTLPASSNCEVHAKTVSGTISGKPWQEISRGQARTRLGAGVGSVEISTVSGDIRLNTKG